MKPDPNLARLPSDFREKMRAQEAMLAFVHVIMRDGEGRITFWNRTDEDIYGWTPDEARGRDAFELLHTELPTDRAELEATTLASGRWKGEIVHVDRSGGRHFIMTTWTPHFDETGEHVAFIEANCDITGQRIAEAKLPRRGEDSPSAETSGEERGALEHRVAESTAAFNEAAAEFDEVSRKFATLVEASPVAIIGLDADQHIAIWNAEAERLFGLGHADVRAKSLLDLPVGWESPEALAALLAAPGEGSVNVSVASTDGRRALEIWSASYPASESSPPGRVLLAFDETEKRFLEHAFLEAGQREQRRIGQELHDHLAQQLLGAAFGAQALFKELESTGSASASRAGDLARLINTSVSDARDIARGVNPIEVDSAGLVSALQELVDRTHSSADIELQCDPPVLVPQPEIALHVFRIAQEALTNALHHSRASAVQIRLFEAGSGDRATLQIVDNGTAPAEDSASDANVGIGIMKYRAKAIRGELSVERATSGGTTISCTFANPV